MKRTNRVELRHFDRFATLLLRRRRRTVDLLNDTFLASFGLAFNTFGTGWIPSHPVVFECHIRAVSLVTLKVAAKVRFPGNTNRGMC